MRRKVSLVLAAATAASLVLPQATVAAEGPQEIATESMTCLSEEAAAEEAAEAATEESTESAGEAAAQEWETEEAVPYTGKKVTLRVCNWEEYIDEGDWGDDERIELDDGNVFGENDMVSDFEDWYLRTYGVKVNVQYSTFGTNEDLYNMLTLGDVYDVVCPSEYMFMKLMSEDKLVPLSEHFFDETDPHNYYQKGVSPYIRNIFETSEINGENWSKYAAGYMWGVTGFAYNPEFVSEEEASTWHLMGNDKFKRQVTIKDNVRDTYFAAVGALESDKLTSSEFVSDENYHENLEKAMNDTSPEMIARVQDYLQQVRDNVYSFETDSGKADMITGKVLANYQWSGDAVYTMDQADEDDYQLNFAVPRESTNIYFDGWVMLKAGVEGDADKQQAAEAFINYLSRPDNAVRNMYYIGYTSVISGGDNPLVYEYLDYNYGAEEDDDTAVDYDVNYFFAKDGEEDYILSVPEEQKYRQLGAQYPDTETIKRSSIMICFDPEQSRNINQMWVNVRCFNIKNVPAWAWVLTALAAAGLVWTIINKIKKARE